MRTIMKNWKNYRYCFVVTLLCSSITSTPVNEIDVQGHSVALCPDWHFCGSAYYDDPNCGCEPKCLRVGACCTDYLEKNNRSIVDQSLEMQTVCVNTTKTEAFYLVNTCNDTWHDSSTKSLCEEKADDSDILRNLPVSDPTGGPQGIDYKNVYCSVCNYVEKHEVVAWEVTLTCDQTLSNITTLKNIGQDCVTEYRSRASLPVKCDHDVVSSCADNYIASSDEARQCQTYSAVIKINGTAYKNPHCASCNNIEVRNISCTGLDDGDDVIGAGFTNFGPPTKSLSILFDFSASGSSAHVQSRDYGVPEIKNPCEHDEIYNPFEDKCLVVSCAKDMEHIDGECRLLATDGTSHTCETASLIIDYATSSNTTARTCLTEKLSINEADILNVKVSRCNGSSNCFHLNLQIMNSSLPEHFKALVDKTFLNEDTEGPLCSITSIDVTHLCHNVPRGTCYNNSYNSQTTFSGVHNLEWKYGFRYDVDRQIYNMTSDDRVCEIVNQTHLTCPFVIYSDDRFHVHSSKPDHIVHNESGTIYGPTKYDRLKNGSMLVCQESYVNSKVAEIDDKSLQSFITQICIILSLAALLVTFILYCRFKPLRTLPGKSVMNLVGALFLSLLIFLLGSGQTQHQDLCSIVAVLQHFFLLASFFWMNVLAFDVRRTFTFKGSPQNAHRKRNTLILYAFYAWGAPAAIVGICLALIYSPLELDLYYGNSDVCMIGNATMNLIAFGGPVALTLTLNLVFFAMTVVSIRKTKQVTKVVQKNKTTMKSRLEELLIYAKLSTLMGMSWITGFVAAITDSEVVWYIYIVLNSLQGVFVFVFFVCNQRVYKLMKGGANGPSSSKTRSTDVKSGRSNGREASRKSHIKTN